MSATQIYFNPWDPDFYAKPYPHYAPLQTRRRRVVSQDFTPQNESGRWKLGFAKSLRGCSTRFSARASLIRHADAHQSPPGVTKNDQECCHALTAAGTAR